MQTPMWSDQPHQQRQPGHSHESYYNFGYGHANSLAVPPKGPEEVKDVVYVDALPASSSDRNTSEPKQKGKKGCCWTRLSKRTKWIIGITSLLLCGLIIFLVVYFFPKMPTFSVVALTGPDGSSTVPPPTINQPSLPDQSDLSITLNFSAVISVGNANNLGIQMTKLTMDAYLLVNTNTLNGSPALLSYAGYSNLPPINIPSDYAPRLIGQGESGARYFPKTSTVTILTPFIIQYNPVFPANGTIFDDPVIAEFLQVCGLTSTNRTMRIQIKARTWATVSSFPVTNDIVKMINVTCPFPKSQLVTTLQNIGLPFNFTQSANA